MVSGSQRLPQVQIAVDTLVGDELATGALEHVARRRRVLGQLRHRVHRCVEAGGHVRHRRRRDRRTQLVGEHAVHHRDRLAQPVRFGGEVATHLVGLQVDLGVEVPGAGLRHRPTVGCVLHVVVQHRQ